LDAFEMERRLKRASHRPRPPRGLKTHFASHLNRHVRRCGHAYSLLHQSLKLFGQPRVVKVAPPSGKTASQKQPAGRKITVIPDATTPPIAGWI